MLVRNSGPGGAGQFAQLVNLMISYSNTLDLDYLPGMDDAFEQELTMQKSNPQFNPSLKIQG